MLNTAIGAANLKETMHSFDRTQESLGQVQAQLDKAREMMEAVEAQFEALLVEVGEHAACSESG